MSAIENLSVSRLFGICLWVLFASPGRAQERTNEAFRDVADRMVKAINAADYEGLRKDFNKDMLAAFPVEKCRTFFSKEISGRFGKISKLEPPELKSAAEAVFVARCERGGLAFTLTFDDQGRVAGMLFRPDPTVTFRDVADRMVKAINAADYEGLRKDFNKEMLAAFPVEKCRTFFSKEIAGRFGKISKLEPPELKSAAEAVFVARCERGALAFTLTLDEQGRVAGMLFRPDPTVTFRDVADRMVKAINAADYEGIRKDFNKDMLAAFSVEKCRTFFSQEVSGRFGKISKLEPPQLKSPAEAVFVARCERGALDFTLTLDDQGRVAGMMLLPR